MPGSSDDESVDSLDEWLKGGPSSKKAVAVGAHVVGTTTGDDEDSDLDSVDREIERMMREARAKAGSASGRKEGESSSSPPPMPDGEDDSDLDSVDREIERMLKERRERSANKEDTEEKTVDEKNPGSMSGGVESLPESSLSPEAAPNAARASARTSTTPTKRSCRGVGWHHLVDVMERRKRRRRARAGCSRPRNIDSDSDDDDDDDDDLLEYARAAELSKKRRREEEAKAEAERARLAAASANADETRQDYCDDGDAGKMEADSNFVRKSAAARKEDIHDEDDIVESDDSDVEIIEESDDDSDEDQYKSPTNHRRQTQRTPSPHKRRTDAAAPTLPSEAICLDMDSDGDEEIEEPTHPLLSSPPPHMDSSSWHTVRKIQEQDRKEAAGTRGLFSTGFSPGKRKMSATHSTDDVNNDAELTRAEDAAEAETKRRRRLTQGPSTFEEVFATLDKCQRLALRAVENEARPCHDAALPKVRARVIKLGYKPDDLDRCLNYIHDEAPVIIHLTEQCLGFLVKDTHYSSIFETWTGGGTGIADRRQWEHSMFGPAYDRCSAFQRSKYGCVNITGDIEGVKPARHYGRLFMTLKKSVRHRCTFFDKDTGGFDTHKKLKAAGSGFAAAYDYAGLSATSATSLATSRYYAHVLEGYADDEIKSILDLSRVGGGQSICQMYKEAQIHGPVCLATDVEALSVPGREIDASKALGKLVTAFQKQTKCSVLWQGDLFGYDNSGIQMPRPEGSVVLGSLRTDLSSMISGPTSKIMSSRATGGAIPFTGIGHRLGNGLGSASDSRRSRYGSSSAAPFSGKGHRLGGGK